MRPALLSILVLAKARAKRLYFCDTARASNAGQCRKRRNPKGESALGRLAALLAP
jgi:hypothetical protein